MNTASLPLSGELLEYYRQRVEKSEQDYQDALDALEKIKISHKEYHEVAWELHQRTNEIASLQTSLTDAETLLFEERKQLLRSLAENDELRLQELKDRKKIRYLLAMYGLPDQEETTYFKEELEKRFVRRADDANRGTNKTNGYFDDMETIDTEDSESLRLRCKALKAQLDEQARLFEETIASLKNEKETIAQESNLRHKHDSERIAELLNKLQKVQSFCRENTREMLEMKKAHRIFERRTQEEKARLRDELGTVKMRYGQEKGRNDTVEKTVEDRVSRKNEILINELRQNLARCENMLDDERKKQAEVEKSYKRKLEALQQRMDNTTNESKSIKKRRQHEIEGFTNDIQLLKKEIKKLEKQYLKVLNFDDREKEYLEYAKQTGTKAARMSNALHDIKSQLYETERNLHSLGF